jgi:hypothetical protein
LPWPRISRRLRRLRSCVALGSLCFRACVDAELGRGGLGLLGLLLLVLGASVGHETGIGITKLDLRRSNGFSPFCVVADPMSW